MNETFNVQRAVLDRMCVPEAQPRARSTHPGNLGRAQKGRFGAVRHGDIGILLAVRADDDPIDALAGQGVFDRVCHQRLAGEFSGRAPQSVVAPQRTARAPHRMFLCLTVFEPLRAGMIASTLGDDISAI